MDGKGLKLPITMLTFSHHIRIYTILALFAKLTDRRIASKIYNALMT